MQILQTLMLASFISCKSIGTVYKLNVFFIIDFYLLFCVYVCVDMYVSVCVVVCVFVYRCRGVLDPVCICV